MAEESVSKQPELIRVDGGTPDVPCYFLNLHIQNIRCFGPLQVLDLSDGHRRPVQWTILLGDNGVGKTTLLQSLAAMLPHVIKSEIQGWSKQIEQIGGYVPEIFSHHLVSGKYKTFVRTGSNQFRLSAEFGFGSKINSGKMNFKTMKVGVEFIGYRGSSSGFPRDARDLNIYGYGAARRMGPGALSETRQPDPTATLFDDNCPLLNAEEWLLQADYAATKSDEAKARERRDRIKDILVRLLPDVEDIRIEPSGEKTPVVEAHTPYGWVPMRALSSGYRSVVAWMVDLASRLFDRYPNSPDPLAEPAVVLVDQIDVYLHPKWQRDLIQHLTKVFRNTQFIVTAHSPLIVQAAAGANLVVLRREGDHVIIDQKAESVRGWRLDQIVASDLFDNTGARDPETEALLEERRKILAKAHLSQADKARLEELENKIGPLPFGETPEEIRAMDIIERAAKKLHEQGV